ncbi:HAMP domain-containing sensor histidine kinase [soil metagenome]
MPVPGRRWPLRRRLVAGTTVAVGALLLVGALAAAVLLRRTLEADTQSILVDRVNAVAALIADGELPRVLQPEGEQVGQVQVVDADGNVLAISPGLGSNSRLNVIPPPASGKQTTATVDGTVINAAAGSHYRVVARTVPTGVGPLTIYAVTSLDSAASAERHLRNELLLGWPVLTLLGSLIVYLVVGRALRPVEKMRTELDSITSSELARRVDAGPAHDEISRLGTTLNQLLERIEDASIRQGLFAAAAAHELRSPMSAIRTELEVGLAYPSRAQWPLIAEDLLVELARLETLAQDMRTLTRPRAASAAAVHEFDLAAVTSAELGRHRSTRNIKLTAQLSPVTVAADPEAALQVLRNLLANAERHADSRITVQVEQQGDGATLAISNDGAAIPPDKLEEIFEPFVRLDEARSLDSGGSGLGLAICRSLMVVCGGTLTAEHVDNGARFVAWFPAPTARTG